MMNKMVARIGFMTKYHQVMMIEVKKDDKDHFSVFKASLWRTGFWMWRRMLPLSAQTNGE